MVLDEDKHVRTLGAEYALATLFLVVLLLIAISAEKRHLPASIAIIAVGAAVGAVLWPGGAGDALGMQRVASFDDDVFYFLLLPPIIFVRCAVACKPCARSQFAAQAMPSCCTSSAATPRGPGAGAAAETGAGAWIM